jgi:hypothetical protein
MSGIKRKEILMAHDGNGLSDNELLFAVFYVSSENGGVHFGLRIPDDARDTFCSLDAEDRALGLALLEKLFESLKQELTVRQ